MKNRWTIVAMMIIALVFITSNSTPIYANELVGNQVNVALVLGNWYSIDEDRIENIPLEWDHQWFTSIGNTQDGGPAVLNPKVQLQTNLELVRFRPDDPSVFTAEPNLGLYTWHFDGFELEEPALLTLSAWEIEDTLIVRPRFSASRSVEPEILTEETTLQTVTVTFKLEEPLPPNLTYLGIHIGRHVIAYEEDSLVEGHFISQISVEGWEDNIEGVQAVWRPHDPSTIEIGKTYEFQVILEAVKSPNLLGSPLFKPEVQVGYNRWSAELPVTGNSIIITDPNNIISATFTADNEVDWNPGFSDYVFNFHFNTVNSQIWGVEPPFYVLIPADIQIKPETLNLKSKGVITAFVQLPEQYSVEDIDIASVKCYRIAPAIRGVIDGDTLILKFKRQDLQNIEPGKEVNLLVTGLLTDESIFWGRDVVRVIR